MVSLNSSWRLLIISILPLIAAGISLFVATTAWRRKNVPGSIELAGLMLAITIWSLLESLEKFATTIPDKIFWSQIQYIGIASVPVLFLIFSARYSRQDHWLSKPVTTLLWLEPIVTISMVATNALHMLHWSGFSLNQETNLLTYHYGPWFFIHASCAYIYNLIALFLLIRAALSYKGKKRQQFSLVILAVLFPLGANVVHIFHLIPVQGLDPTPLAFAFSGFLLAISITEFNLIDLTPIARTKLVDTLQDAIVVIDNQGNVVDVNPAAQQIIHTSFQEAFQKPAAVVLRRWPYLRTRFSQDILQTTDVKVIPDDSNRWYETRISTLKDEKDKLTGYLVVLRDITDQKTTSEQLSRLAAVIEQANTSILITKLNGEIVYVNPYFEKSTGYMAEEVLGQNASFLKSGHHAPDFFEDLWKTIQTGKIWTGIFINKRKDGQEYYGATNIFPIKKNGGKITHYAAVTRDISAEVRAEKALKYFTNQLTALHQVSIELSIIESADELLHQIVWWGHQRLGFEGLCLRLMDPSNANFLSGTYSINEDHQLQDDRNLHIHVSKDPLFNRLLYNDARFLYLRDEPLRNINAEIIGTGDIAIAGIWEKETLKGYLSIDNFQSKQPISEQHTTILVLYCQTISNLILRNREEQELQFFSEQLAILHDISFELSQEESLDEMCRSAVELGSRRLDFNRIQIWFLNHENNRTLNGTYRIEPNGDTIDERFTSIPVDSHPLHNQAFSGSKRITHLHNTDLYNIHADRLGHGDLVVASLWDEEKITGYLLIDNAFQHTPFTAYRLDLILLFAQTISNLFTRIKGIQETQRKAIQQEFLNEITRTAIEQTDFPRMLQTIADRLGRLFLSDGCFITLWDEENELIQPGAFFGSIQDFYRSEFNLDQNQEISPLSEVVITNGRVIAVDQVENAIITSQRLEQMASIRSMLGLPLMANQQKLGAAILTYCQSHHFTREEITLGEKAAHQIALAILKTRLLEEAENRATEAETLRQASAAVAGTLEREVAIERILEELNRVVPYDSASVQLLIRGELEIVGERGFEDPASVIGLRFPISEKTPNARVVALGEPYIIEDAPVIFAGFRKPPHEHIHGWMGVPLKVHDKIIGMLALDSVQSGRFTKDHGRLATAFADQVAIALENTRLFEETQWLAIHDSLTGIYNRRHLLTLAWTEFQRSIRYKSPLSIIMLDIDHFKNVNDTYGHLIGDQVLQHIANLCENNLRINDLIGRYGGEEFVILLPETTATSGSSVQNGDQPSQIEPAKIVAERLRLAVESAPAKTDRGEIHITISLGIAELSPNTQNIEQLIDKADQALLQAKQTGRNRVVVWNKWISTPFS